MSWLTGRITTSPCCCTLTRPLSSWSSWPTTPSSAFLIKRPSRESRRSPTPCKSPRGTVCLLHCTAFHDPVSAGCQLEVPEETHSLTADTQCLCLFWPAWCGRLVTHDDTSAKYFKINVLWLLTCYFGEIVSELQRSESTCQDASVLHMFLI